MNNKVLVGQLVDFYCELESTIIELTLIGGVSGEEIAELNNLKIHLDKILTNSSKRWAKGKRQP